MQVAVMGAGVAGLTCAVELVERGASVEIFERGRYLGEGSCSWFAGGMLAPWCELETATPLIAELGMESLEWWWRRFPGTAQGGSLVVAQARDRVELDRFARRTQHFRIVDRGGIGALEPYIADRFDVGLHFPSEAHLDPRAALAALAERLQQLGVPIRCGVDAARTPPRADRIVDCRGIAAIDALPDLRGVKGEMAILRTFDVELTRPVRVLHPRTPVYVIPRANGLFMVGATSLECGAPATVSARSTTELLNAAYALHPAFAAADVVEIGAGIRPAFADNRPRLRWRGRVLHVNGLYRHGFLLAPALARRVSEAVLHERYFPEVMDEDHRERCFV